MASNDELIKSRGFPMTPPEENTGRDGIVVQVAAGQTVVADSNQSEVFIIHARREDAVNYALQGNDLVVEFADGQKLTIRGFFAGPAGGDQLVFIDGEQPYWVDFSQALNGVGDGIAENQLHWYIPVEEHGVLWWLWGLLGLLAIGAAVALDNDDDSATPPPN